MNIILTGATGFIGHEILSKVLVNKTFTSVVVLSRRPIPDQHPKLTTVVLEDFTVYPPSVIKELSGAQACIWYSFLGPLDSVFIKHTECGIFY